MPPHLNEQWTISRPFLSKFILWFQSKVSGVIHIYNNVFLELTYGSNIRSIFPMQTNILSLKSLYMQGIFRCYTKSDESL